MAHHINKELKIYLLQRKCPFSFLYFCFLIFPPKAALMFNVPLVLDTDILLHGGPGPSPGHRPWAKRKTRATLQQKCPPWSTFLGAEGTMKTPSILQEEWPWCACKYMSSGLNKLHHDFYFSLRGPFEGNQRHAGVFVRQTIPAWVLCHLWIFCPSQFANAWTSQQDRGAKS